MTGSLMTSANWIRKKFIVSFVVIGWLKCLKWSQRHALRVLRKQRAFWAGRKRLIGILMQYMLLIVRDNVYLEEHPILSDSCRLTVPEIEDSFRFRRTGQRWRFISSKMRRNPDSILIRCGRKQWCCTVMEILNWRFQRKQKHSLINCGRSSWRMIRKPEWYRHGWMNMKTEKSVHWCFLKRHWTILM